MKIIIVGSGFSGLATATFLSSMGIKKEDITILEKSAHIGGFINSVNKGGYIIETGPEGIRGNAEVANQLIDIAGARDIAVPSSDISANRYLVHKGRLVKLPHGPFSAITTPLINFKSKLRLLAEPFIKSKNIPEESTLGELIERRFGKGIDHILDAFISGVYAGDHRKLSASFVFPQLAKFEREAGSIIKGGMRYAKEKKKLRKMNGEVKKKVKMPFLMNFRHGMSDLVKKMAEDFEIKCNTLVTTISKKDDKFLLTTPDKTFSADIVIISTNPNNIPLLEFENLPTFDQMPTPPVAVVALGFDEKDVANRPRGYGYLSPSKEQRFALGTLFTSDVFPHHAPEGKVLYRVILGGRRYPELVELDDATLLEKILIDVKHLLNLGDVEPEFTHIIRHKSGIPQLELGHQKIDDFRVHVESKYPGIYFNAIGWTGIATAHLAEEAKRIAEKIVST